MTDFEHDGDRVAPPGITDPMLWRLAAAVAAAHRTDHRGRCGNLQCAAQTSGDCAAARLARHALRLAQVPWRPHLVAACRRSPVVPAAGGAGFGGWFTATPPPLPGPATVRATAPVPPTARVRVAA